MVVDHTDSLSLRGRTTTVIRETRGLLIRVTQGMPAVATIPVMPTPARQPPFLPQYEIVSLSPVRRSKACMDNRSLTNTVDPLLLPLCLPDIRNPAPGTTTPGKGRLHPAVIHGMRAAAGIDVLLI